MWGTVLLLAEIAEVFSGRPPQKVDDGAPSSEVPIVAMRDVGVRIAPRTVLDTVVVGGQPDPRRRLQPGDVLVTSRGRVRAAVAQSEHAGVLVGPNLMLVRPTGRYPASLLAAFLRHPAIEARLLELTATSGTPGFTMDDIRSLELGKVTSDRARKLARLVEETDAYVRDIQAGAGRLNAAAVETVFAHLHVEPTA